MTSQVSGLKICGWAGNANIQMPNIFVQNRNFASYYSQCPTPLSIIKSVFSLFSQTVRASIFTIYVGEALNPVVCILTRNCVTTYPQSDVNRQYRVMLILGNNSTDFKNLGFKCVIFCCVFYYRVYVPDMEYGGKVEASMSYKEFILTF